MPSCMSYGDVHVGDNVLFKSEEELRALGCHPITLGMFKPLFGRTAVVREIRNRFVGARAIFHLTFPSDVYKLNGDLWGMIFYREEFEVITPYIFLTSFPLIRFRLSSEPPKKLFEGVTFLEVQNE